MIRFNWSITYDQREISVSVSEDDIFECGGVKLVTVFALIGKPFRSSNAKTHEVAWVNWTTLPLADLHCNMAFIPQVLSDETGGSGLRTSFPALQSATAASGE